MQYSPPQQRSSLEDGQYDAYSASCRNSSGSARSELSYRTQSTADTDYDDMVFKTANLYLEGPPLERERALSTSEANPRSSVETYASTVPSLKGLDPAHDGYQVPAFYPDRFVDEAIPCTPADFGALFPSTRKLYISHDESTLDGNMNLKVTTQARTPRGRLQNMILFHLRLYDLKAREFSLRRYDRDSGREVCHTVSKSPKPAAHGLTGVQRCLSSAFANIRSRSVHRMDPARNRSKRSIELQEDERRPRSSGHDTQLFPRVSTNTTKLEFSNYAQAQLRRRGTGANKRYDFEYWGTTYSWKRVVNKFGEEKLICFHLHRSGEDHTLAKIMPEPLSPSQQRDEQTKGAWVPPCSMWINDERLVDRQKDLADVIVASGLVALVDDRIKTCFRPSRHASDSAFSRRNPGNFGPGIDSGNFSSPPSSMGASSDGSVSSHPYH